MSRSIAVTIVIVVVIFVSGASGIYFSTLGASSQTNTLSATTGVTTNSSASSAPVYTYNVINSYHHDTGAFTEGLVYYNGFIYESTGIYGNSSLRRVDLNTGQVLQIYHLSSQYFGEGIAIVNDTIIQLTWQNDTGFVYALNSFNLLSNFTYSDQGWGLTYDGNQLIMSDGTANLYYLNPQTFQRTGSITVHDGNATIVDLNSLGYINGSIFANVWLTNRIAVINPGTGQVTAWIDLTGIENMTGCHCDVSEAVLNGIAYDAVNHRLFVTGKLWPNIFQIEVVPALPSKDQPYRPSDDSPFLLVETACSRLRGAGFAKAGSLIRDSL